MRTKVNIGFAAALLILSTIGLVSYRNTIVLVQSSDQVQQTQIILTELERLSSALEELESNQLNYLIYSGDASKLGDYDTLIDTVRQTMQQLRTLTRDNAYQQGRLILLEPLIDRRIDLFKEVIEVHRRKGLKSAQNVADRSAQIMLQVRTMLDRMQEEERNLLPTRSQRVASSAETVMAVIALGSTLAFIFVGIASLLVNRDITKREAVERELQLQRDFALQVVNAMGQGLTVTDAEGRFEHVNPAYARMIGYSPQEMIGKFIIDVTFAEDCEVFQREHMRRMAGKTSVYESRLRKSNGQPVHVLITGVPRWHNGTVIGSIAVLTDMTERKKVEQLKNEFISTVSHELRTPLTSIRGALGLVVGGVAGPVPAQVRTMLDIAHKNSERLVRLVNDILDIERIESGKMMFHMEVVDIQQLTEQAIEANRNYAEELGVNLELVEKLPGVKVYGDSDRLMQVLTNLLSNAAKFSPAGGQVRVTLRRSDGMLQVLVSDEGPGIPEDFYGRVFQKFAQADASDTRQKGGTGLGLSIAKAIIERLEGRIGFESRVGLGTTFFFELPEWEESVAHVDGQVEQANVMRLSSA